MTPPKLDFRHEDADDETAIEALNEEAFGPGRFTRAAHLIREGGAHHMGMSFVALDQGQLIASVRMTEIMIGRQPAMLLGPIVVAPQYKSVGIGAILMNMALKAAQDEACMLVILVGDEPYYSRFGFIRTHYGKIIMPAPVNPARLLAYEIVPGILEHAEGRVIHKNRWHGS